MNSMSDEIERAAQVHPLNPDSYRREGICALVNQIVHPNNPHRNINEAHCHTLAVSFCSYKYNYGRYLMIVYFSSAIDREGVIYDSAIDNIQDKNVLNDSTFMVMLDGRHRHNSVEMLRDEDVEGWAAHLRRMQEKLWLDSKAILPAQTLNLSKVTNISTSII